MKAKSFAILGLSLLMFGCSNSLQKSSIQLAHSNYEIGDYQDSLDYVQQAERYGSLTPAIKAELTYLKAQSYEAMGYYDKIRCTIPIFD